MLMMLVAPSGSSFAAEITIYPILAHVPIFGANINIPDLPNRPGGSGTTDVSLNGAYGFGLTIESRRWLLDTNGLWAALSARATKPVTFVNSDTRFFNATAGVRIVKGLFATAGVRRVATDLSVELEVASPNAAPTPLSGVTNPALWDPMIGAQYRGRLTQRTTFDLSFRGGGFGVGTDVDIDAEAAVNWRFMRHVELRAGYEFVYFKETVDNAIVNAIQRPLIAEQTLHGPEIGIGIAF
jgi:hypothetical protein